MHGAHGAGRVKDCAALQLFKAKIKTWRSDTCQCQICSKYIANFGYFQFVFLWPKVNTRQNCTVVNCKLPKYPFSVKAMYVSPWVWSNFISYVKVFVFLQLSICTRRYYYYYYYYYYDYHYCLLVVRQLYAMTFSQFRSVPKQKVHRTKMKFSMKDFFSKCE